MIGDYMKAKKPKHAKPIKKWCWLLSLGLAFAAGCSAIPASESDYPKLLCNIKTICLVTGSSKYAASAGFTSSKIYDQVAAIFKENGFEVLPGTSKKDYSAMKAKIRRLKRSTIREGCDASLVVVVVGSNYQHYKKGRLLQTVPEPSVGKFRKVTKVYEKVPTNYKSVSMAVAAQLNVHGQNALENVKRYKQKYKVKDGITERKKANEFAEQQLNTMLQNYMKTIKKYSPN